MFCSSTASHMQVTSSIRFLYRSYQWFSTMLITTQTININHKIKLYLNNQIEQTFHFSLNFNFINLNLHLNRQSELPFNFLWTSHSHLFNIIILLYLIKILVGNRIWDDKFGHIGNIIIGLYFQPYRSGDPMPSLGSSRRHQPSTMVALQEILPPRPSKIDQEEVN